MVNLDLNVRLAQHSLPQEPLAQQQGLFSQETWKPSQALSSGAHTPFLLILSKHASIRPPVTEVRPRRLLWLPPASVLAEPSEWAGKELCSVLPNLYCGHNFFLHPQSFNSC